MSPILIPYYDEAAPRAAAQACGAQLFDDPHGPQARFCDSQSHTNATQPGARLQAGALCLLFDWGIVSVRGDDAVKFLHAQTTNDIEGQAEDEVRLNAYCTPQGRVLAAGSLWRDAGVLHFAVSRPLAEPLRKRLSMYVLRAKARLENASDAFAVLGLCGSAAAPALRELGIEPPAPGRVARLAADALTEAAAEKAAETGAGSPVASPATTVIGLVPVAGIGGRWWLVVPIASLSVVWARLSRSLVPLDSDHWRASEVLAGEPRVVPATSEAFVPQTLNWELIGGVNFRKGCYPGQEIVARLHYRGKPKRRMFAAGLGEGPPLAPGSELRAGGTSEPAGLVVTSAPGPEGGQVLLYEAPIAAATQGGLSTADGRVLTPLPLPYTVPA
jgi:folate-binding protein YgfZ